MCQSFPPSSFWFGQPEQAREKSNKWPGNLGSSPTSANDLLSTPRCVIVFFLILLLSSQMWTIFFSKSLKLCGCKLCFYYAFIYNENILSLGLLHSPALWIALARQEMHNKVGKPSSNGSQSFLPQTCSAWNLNLLFPEPLFYLPYIWVTQGIITFCKSELSSLLSMQQWQKACSPHSLPRLNFFCAHIPTVLRDYWSRSAVMALHVQLCWHWSYLK